MADTKISALTNATTPLAGTEVLPLVQSGATVKVAVSNLTAGRSVSGTSFVPTGSTVPANGLYLPATDTVGFASNTTERARIDSSGNFLIGKTVTTFTTPGISLVPNNASSFATTTVNGNFQLSAPVNQSQMAFYRQDTGGLMGYITNGAASTVLYVTTSDYRLKENIAPMTGALATVAQLKPVTYKWKADGSDGQGFIAHELQEIVSSCVSGQKDSVDADGKPRYQGIDTSFLVATLTAAIQEQQALITSLTARLTALESR